MSSVDEAGTSGQPVASSPDQSVSIPGDALIIVAVRNTVLFPGMIAPITLGRPIAIAAAQQGTGQEFHEDCDNARQEAAQVVSLTPRIIRWTSRLSPPYRCGRTGFFYALRCAGLRVAVKRALRVGVEVKPAGHQLTEVINAR